MSTWQQLSENFLSVEQVRSVDRRAIDDFGMHSLVLMENAARNCAQWFMDGFMIPPTTVILCGRGNNGGDGLAIARHLEANGWPCRTLLLGPLDNCSDDARANWQVLSAGANANCCLVQADDEPSLRVAREWISEASVIVDAMLGTGSSGVPREPFASWIEHANSLRAFRVAIDIPTGLNADTGEVAERCFQADVTLTFVAQKIGFSTATAKAVLGEVRVLPIGIPAALIAQLLQESSGE